MFHNVKVFVALEEGIGEGSGGGVGGGVGGGAEED